MKPRISMITLAVDNMERAISFYEKGLGLPRMESPPEVAFFTLNGTWLGLFGRKALAQDAKVSVDGGGFNGFALVHNLASTTEVDELYEEALSLGAIGTKRPQKTSWGGYSGYFKDPENHLWEVAYNPFFWVGPTDTD